MDRMVEFGLISDNLRFIPAGNDYIIPAVTEAPDSELCYEISLDQGEFRGLTSEMWKAKAEHLRQEELCRINVWSEIMDNNPLAIQFRDSFGTVSIISKRNEEYIKTVFDHRGPMTHSHIMREDIFAENPEKGIVNVMF